VAVLPWLYTASIILQGGAVERDDVPVSVWPATGSFPQSAGMHSSHRGEVPLSYRGKDGARVDAAALLQLSNVTVRIVGGPMAGDYKVLAATQQPHGLIPHVGLELRSTGAR
jgi:hypothetical protein